MPPSCVTYAHAIAVCQKARIVDLDTIQLLFHWADADGIAPTEYMLSSAVWAAHRKQNVTLAKEYFNLMKDGTCAPNTVAYSGIICALCGAGSMESALQHFIEAKAKDFELSRSVFVVSHLSLPKRSPVLLLILS